MTNIVLFPILRRDKDREADVAAGLTRMIKDLETMATRINVGLINGNLHTDDLEAAKNMCDQFAPVIADLKAIAWDPRWTEISRNATARHRDLVLSMQLTEAAAVQPHV
ncbi:hypothetical protein N182_35010 [Sinorhizobium sp. GL2]|nr:hypothetical protein N182_35010 [Sinorhizobium sp. GL2]